MAPTIRTIRPAAWLARAAWAAALTLAVALIGTAQARAETTEGPALATERAVALEARAKGAPEARAKGTPEARAKGTPEARAKGAPGARAMGALEAQAMAALAALHLPAEAPRSVVLMLSGAEGWTWGLEVRAARLARARALVIGVDLRRLPRDCAAAGRAAMALAQAAMARAGAEAIPPTLAGHGAGAGLALAMASADPGAMKGLATDRFAAAPGCPQVAEAAMDGRLVKAPVRWFDLADAAGRSAVPRLPGVKTVAPDGRRIRPRDGAAGGAPAMAGGATQAAAIDVTRDPAEGGTQALAVGEAQAAAAGGPQAAAARTAAVRAVATAGPAAVSRGFLETVWAVSGADFAFRAGAAGEPLPVVLHLPPPGAAEREVFALFLSGDGGWAAFDAEVADRLAAAGVPVAGVSLLRWLWREKRPETMAEELAGLIARRSAVWGKRRVLLIGFSMGANVAPFAVRALPEAARARMAGLVLLSPERRTGFEISPAGWLGGETGEADVPPQIAALAPALSVLCVRGEEEAASACAPAPAGVETLALPGGHHLGKDYDRVAAEILGRLAQ